MSQKNRFKAVVAVYLLLIKKDSILLYLRQNTGYGDGQYSLVAGHLDGNESVTNAMIREAREEANIIINPADIEVTCVMHRKASDREVIDYFMKVTKWENSMQNLEPEKCKELRFFDLQALPDNIIPYVKKAIDLSFNGIKFTEFGWDDNTKPERLL